MKKKLLCVVSIFLSICIIHTYYIKDTSHTRRKSPQEIKVLSVYCSVITTILNISVYICIAMTKFRINLTVDPEIINILRQENYNISALVNEYLTSLAVTNRQAILNKDREKLRIEEDQYKKDLTKTISLLQQTQKAIKLIDLEKDQEFELLKLKEESKRWRCPVCKAVNDMTIEHCIGCQLRTRNDKKTIIVYVNKWGGIDENFGGTSEIKDSETNKDKTTDQGGMS